MCLLQEVLLAADHRQCASNAVFAFSRKADRAEYLPALAQQNVDLVDVCWAWDLMMRPDREILVK